MLIRPEYGLRSCGDCIRYHHEENGNIKRNLFGDAVPRDGSAPTECHECPKIPNDGRGRSRFQAVDMDDQCWAIYWHWQRCRATNSFPQGDESVRQAAVVCQGAHDDYDEYIAGKRQWDAIQATLLARVNSRMPLN